MAASLMVREKEDHGGVFLEWKRRNSVFCHLAWGHYVASSIRYQRSRPQVSAELVGGIWGTRVITRKVQLGIICIEMILSVMGVDDITDGPGVYCEKDGAEDVALRDSTVKGARYCDTLGSVREI